jgi:hypothetical protein
MVNEQAVDRLSFEFFLDNDDLDSFRYVIMKTSVDVFALRLYDHQPAPGYVLIGMENAGSAEEQVRTFLAATGLDTSDLTWRVFDDPTGR